MLNYTLNITLNRINLKSQERKLKDFGSVSTDANSSGPEISVRKNLQMSMARKLQALSTTFRQKQRVIKAHR